MSSLITTIQPEERDGFGQYQIHSGCTHIFPFAIPLLGSVELTVAHILPNSQDFSIDLWISKDPLDGLLLGNGVGHIKLIRRTTKITIYDEFLALEDDERLFLPSGKIHYINIKNLQNRPNAYQLDIEEKSPTPLF